jgi:hypothetical protein
LLLTYDLHPDNLCLQGILKQDKAAADREEEEEEDDEEKEVDPMRVAMYEKAKLRCVTRVRIHV